jgi:hypothetical protein
MNVGTLSPRVSLGTSAIDLWFSDGLIQRPSKKMDKLQSKKSLHTRNIES